MVTCSMPNRVRACSPPGSGLDRAQENSKLGAHMPVISQGYDSYHPVVAGCRGVLGAVVLALYPCEC
ncbi:hypothetical protein SAMN06265360_10417 [Haloechinothrix alba]|uniref:Uncharacterized protein n=1 Tax=Haloechinothrix alba TaxID=664784 RepID=A0A238VV20_9PSEU|nr:hypothetical protein SAMN06265360_10417 [Haloechinothrix alba]